MTGCCLGDVAAALVDGELDHAARERAHRHLAHCGRCRAEVDGQRRLKARLTASDPAQPPAGLTDRLLRLSASLEEPAPRAPEVRPPSRRPPEPVAASRPSRGDQGSQRPRTGRARRAVRGRVTTGSAVALLGVAAALALGAPQPRSSTTPVDPATDAFVTEFVSTTAGGGPTADAVPAARTAGLTTFVPLTRAALLSSGGTRSTR